MILNNKVEGFLACQEKILYQKQFTIFKRQMNDYFVFPVNFEDLQQNDYHRHYVTPVNLDLHEKDILIFFRKLDQQLRTHYSNITEHQHFDFLYTLIKGFGENIEFKSMRVLEKLSESLIFAGKTMYDLCTKVSHEESQENLRIAYKMVMFLILFFVANVSKGRQKTQADMIADAISKDGGRKKRARNEIELSRVVIQNVKMIIELLKDTLGIDYKILWERKEVDPELFKRYTDVCVKILESSLAKEEEIIQSIFYILEVIIKEKPQLFPNIQRVLINLVYESEMIDTLVQFFSKAEGPELQRLCEETIICVVVYLVQKNLSSEANSIKNTKQFLSKLSQKIPKMFYNNLSCFIRLYQHESYHLRNAISDIIFNILRFFLRQECQESLNNSRQKFINTLIQRIYDKSSFCRWHVLGILNQLSMQKIIPRKYLIMFLKAGVDRIKDSSINTRKKALQLINTIIDDVWPEGKELRTQTQIADELGMIELNKKMAMEQEEKIRESLETENEVEKIEQLSDQLRLLKKTIKEAEIQESALLEEKQIMTLINDVLAKVKILLGSKTESDVLETIKLFIKFYKRNVAYCKQSLPSIRLLIFSREKKIKDEVLNTFAQLHLTKSSQEVARELVHLFKQASSQDLSALEEILETILIKSMQENVLIIKPAVFAYLWNSFIEYERNETNTDAKRAIITIMRIAYSKDPLMIKQENMESFLNIMKKYISTGQQDFHILKEITKILILDNNVVRYNSRNFIIAAVYILVNCQGVVDNEWYSTSEHVLNCIFKISESPEKLTEVFIKKLHDNLQKSCSSTSVAHFIFTLSDSCLKMLIHLDTLENRIKAKKFQENQNEQNEEQIDKVLGGFEAQLQRKIEEIQNLAERIIHDPFTSRWVKVVEKISNELETGNQLEIIAVLSYCKFMCISPEYCQDKFSNLIHIMNKPNISSVIKNNIIIAVGDLLHRFPNIVEPYSKFLYQNLHDRDPRVRKTTLTVVTHLSLNDMIKVKSDLCEIAILFQDQDSEIEGLVKQFFHELNRKDPKMIFNMIPEALIKFSDLPNLRFGDEKTFQVFLENVLPFMEKDKYSESLISKLCERLANSLNILESKNTAHCLAQLNMNEKGLRKIIQNFSSFKQTLQTTEVLNSFRSLISKLKKSTKNEIKGLVDELEQKILHSNEDVYNAQEIKKRNERNQKKGVKRKSNTKGRTSNTSNSNSQKRRRTGGGRKKKPTGIEEESQFDQESEEAMIDADAPVRPKRRLRRPAIVEQSEEESDEKESVNNFNDQ